MRWSREYATRIVCGITECATGALYSSAVVVSRGELLLTHRKVQLWPHRLTLFNAGDVLKTGGVPLIATFRPKENVISG